jgi:hypothetical protein
MKQSLVMAPSERVTVATTSMLFLPPIRESAVTSPRTPLHRLTWVYATETVA